MNLLWTIIIFIAIIIVLSIIMRFLKRTVRFIVTAVIIILLIGAGLYLYQDANDLRKNFVNKEKLFLLDMSGEIVAGFTSKGFGPPITLNDISALNELYQEKNYKQMKDEYYKLIIFKWPAFNNIEKVSDKEYTITKQEAQRALLSDNPKKLYIDKTVELKGEQYREFIEIKANEEFPTQTHFKGIIFGLFVSEAGEENLMIPEFKKGNVIIYPEKVILRIVEVFPQEMLEKFLPIKTSHT